ncbi:MAG: hypothetical protein D6714_03655 [Bacteroidetes bacterium]|nr:MAG: hypothetical protein D6714_03655 [Bacteroidota bacterium]
MLWVGLAATVGAQTPLEAGLFQLPDVIFTPVEAPEGFEAAYELKIRQPIDHQHPEKGYFYQRAFLTHAGFDRPTVIATEGYNRSKNRMYELTRLLHANQLDVEHRYFGASVPDSLDYTYLNFAQATADLHHINQLFRQLYPGKWVSTGISKGGTTTIFYRYFYPDDVDVSVPYVAPVNYSTEDTRIYDFLDTIGTDACRAAILDYQRRMLQIRDEILPCAQWFTKGKDLRFNYLSFGEAYEYAVLEYSFSFWQWGHKCEDIPGPDASNDEMLQHLIDVVGFKFFSDSDIEYYGSHYYQSATEMGYYGYKTDPFKGLLKYLPERPYPSAIFVPGKQKVQWNGTLTNQVARWTQTGANQFIYIIGANDTWSATAVPPSDKVDAVWFKLKGQDHAGARIRNMTPAEKALLIQKLEGWLQMDIEE